MKWVDLPKEPTLESSLLSLELPPSSGLVKHIAWHRKGDYFATVCGSFFPAPPTYHADNSRSQWRGPGRSFDPSSVASTFPSSVQEDQGLCPARLVPPVEAPLLCRSPCICSPRYLFSSSWPSQTQRYVRIYNLAEQKLLKMLTPGIRWISSMDVHPSGDHLIVGGYDRKLCWFDLELSEKPYKILRYAKLVLHEHYVLLISRTRPADTILVRSGRCIFIRHIRCSHRHPTTVRSRSSMHACTVTSSQILLSYRSRSCVGMTYVRG